MLAQRPPQELEGTRFYVTARDASFSDPFYEGFEPLEVVLLGPFETFDDARSYCDAARRWVAGYPRGLEQIDGQHDWLLVGVLAERAASREVRPLWPRPDGVQSPDPEPTTYTPAQMAERARFRMGDGVTAQPCRPHTPVRHRCVGCSLQEPAEGT